MLSPNRPLQYIASQSTLRHSVYEVPGHVELSKRQLIVVSIIQDVQQISVEGVNVIHFWEVIQYLQAHKTSGL